MVEKVETLELLKGLVSIWLADLKTLNSNLSKKLFGADDYPEVATKAIKWMIENNPLVIANVEKKDSSLNKMVQKEKVAMEIVFRSYFQTVDKVHGIAVDFSFIRTSKIQ